MKGCECAPPPTPFFFSAMLACGSLFRDLVMTADECNRGPGCVNSASCLAQALLVLSLSLVAYSEYGRMRDDLQASARGNFICTAQLERARSSHCDHQCAGQSGGRSQVWEVTPLWQLSDIARLARSPPTGANRAQSLAASPDFRKWESCPDDAVDRRIFSGISRSPRPFIPAPLHTHFNHFIGSKELDVKSRPNLFTSLHQSVAVRNKNC
ncbi:hypothetical protein PR048_031629 [Dryococelus australis]|uniref:Uncharacterized protein n=1 Tax=Dryococelus australis TaxID=614101 RepID=A0ABQ9G9U8_9NEOP|nr:hypothetical protein PR048_031629 [Dryococelus australis]